MWVRSRAQEKRNCVQRIYRITAAAANPRGGVRALWAAGEGRAMSGKDGRPENDEPRNSDSQAQAPRRGKWWSEERLNDLLIASRTTTDEAWNQRRLLFSIARHIKGHARTLPGFEDAAAVVDPAVEDLSGRRMNMLKPVLLEAYVRLGKEAFGEDSFDQLWLAFLDAWAKIKTPAGDEILRVAFERARRNPPIVKLDAATDRLRIVAGVAYYLALLVPGGGAIHLPRKRLAGLLDCSHTAVGTMVKHIGQQQPSCLRLPQAFLL